MEALRRWTSPSEPARSRPEEVPRRAPQATRISYLTLVFCPFCHNPTLQDDRLPSVTARVTKPSGERTSQNRNSRKFKSSILHSPARIGLKSHSGAFTSCIQGMYQAVTYMILRRDE